MDQLKQSVINKTVFSFQFVRMRLLEKLVTIIWVGSELKRSEGKNVTLAHLPNQRGVLISTGGQDTSFNSIGSLPKSNNNGGTSNTIAGSKSGDYRVQGEFTQMSF